MFFCEECKKKKGWPGLIPSSYGRCEICGKGAGCYDVPSRYLPVPEKKKRKKQK